MAPFTVETVPRAPAARSVQAGAAQKLSIQHGVERVAVRARCGERRARLWPRTKVEFAFAAGQGQVVARILSPRVPATSPLRHPRVEAPQLLSRTRRSLMSRARASALPGSLVANPRLESCTEGKPARRGK